MTRAPRLVLVIVADQLRADHVGFGGLDLGHTPHLDSIAAAGTTFDRAYVTNPVCMPSRATLATGMWPSTHGTRTNGVPLDPSARTLAKTLRETGWNTAAVGKLHYQPMGWGFLPYQQTELDGTGTDATAADIPDAWQRSGRLANWDWELLERHRAGLVTMPDDYYGFAEVDLVAGHGDLCAGHYEHWLRAKGIEPQDLGGYQKSPRPSTEWNEVWASALPAEFHTSTYVAERAVAQIEKAAGQDKPTFLFVSFPDPHHPFCPPAPYADRFAPADMPVPGSFHATHQGLPPHIAGAKARIGTPDPDATFLWAPTEVQYREAMAAQLGLLSLLDDSVGTILDALRRTGLADDTLTVFTADHGDMLGDHGLLLKHYAHYEAITRVPFVISGDGIESGRSDALISNADLVPTILDRSGMSPWRGMQGRSLSGVVEGRTSAFRRAVLIEEDQPIGMDGLPAPVRMRTVVTDEGRLTHYQGQGFGELYDHRVDPDELTNGYAENDHAPFRSKMESVLLDEVLSGADQGRRIEASA